MYRCGLKQKLDAERMGSYTYVTRLYVTLFTVSVTVQYTDRIILQIVTVGGRCNIHIQLYISSYTRLLNDPPMYYFGSRAGVTSVLSLVARWHAHDNTPQ